jgi:GDPmannose 4,6-dehydratase
MHYAKECYRNLLLITGITGMVGSHLADYILKNTDWKIVGMARWRSPMDNLKQHVHMLNDPKSRIRLIYGDLNDSFSLLNAVKQANPDFVFHLAAQSFPRTSFDGPLDTLQTNVIGTASLLEALKSNAPKSVIHICSSSEVFGRVPANRIPIDENESFHPASPYAISKAGTDLLGRYYAEAFGMCTLTTRMFTHTGPRRGDVFAESSFAKQIATSARGCLVRHGQHQQRHLHFVYELRQCLPCASIARQHPSASVAFCRKKLCAMWPMRNDLPRKSDRFNLTPFVDPAA